MLVGSDRPTDEQTMSVIEMSWTARRKEQNDNKDKITKNTIDKMSKAEKRRHVRQNRSAQLTHHPPASFSSYHFFSLTAFIYQMWKQCDFDKHTNGRYLLDIRYYLIKILFLLHPCPIIVFDNFFT